MQGRADPLTILRSQEATRIGALASVRYERMAASPFTFLRGAAAVMSADLALLPRTDIRTQLCGDAHLSNFGMFSSRERRLVFDLNDFDETLPGPFEWDVKRLAASIAVAANALGVRDREGRKAARGVAKSYRETMSDLSKLSTLQVWYASLDVDSLVSDAGRSQLAEATRKARKKARVRTSDTAAAKLTVVEEAGRRFVNDPPVLIRIEGDEREYVIDRLVSVYAQYLQTLPPDRLALLAHYSFTDIAHKVVGVGSVGTRAFVLLLESGDGEPLLLQIKQAGESVLAPYLGASKFDNAGQRVVLGQQAMQSTGDPFLGWTRGSESDYFVRQLKDMKGAIDPETLNADSLTQYARLCGAVLARAHARAGDPSLISGYLGSSKAFDHAIGEFAMSYVVLNGADHAALLGYLGAKTESAEAGVQ
jgi:uncharacterized protein (DUF2252 family)